MERNSSRSHGRWAFLAGLSVSILVLTACTSLGILQTEKDVDLAAKIEGQKRIRVLTPNGSAQVLRPTVGVDGVEGRAPASFRPVRFSWAEIREIQGRKHGGRRGLWAGAGLGFLSGLAAGAILHHEAAGELNEGIILMGGAGGCAVGALAGTLVGSLSNGWRTIYLANAGSRPVPAISLVPTPRGGLALTLAYGF